MKMKVLNIRWKLAYISMNNMKDELNFHNDRSFSQYKYVNGWIKLTINANDVTENVSTDTPAFMQRLVPCNIIRI